jgi:dihydrofolate reductase
VLTRNRSLSLPDAIVLSTLEEAVEYARARGEKELFIVGGEEIYRLAMPITQRIYLTRIHAEIEGDTYYPEPDWSEWFEVSRTEHGKDEKNPYDYDFLVFERKN